jgi:hypothetical protein
MDIVCIDASRLLYFQVMWIVKNVKYISIKI